MTAKPDMKVAEDVLRLRFSQIIVNELNRQGEFKLPIHLALGHEAIAVAVDAIMDDEDSLILSHRNIHYNLARSRSLKPKIEEFRLHESGEAGGMLGCMNLFNEEVGGVYSSCVLGNNLPVAVGVALGTRVKGVNGLVIVVTGDGAIEEGTYYESLVMMKTFKTPALVIVENNRWSLATQIHERRCEIRLDRYAAALDIPYAHLSGNDAYGYIRSLRKIRAAALANETPSIVEVELHTLGDWRMETEDFPDGKYINYHAGVAPTLELTDWPVIEESDRDPVSALTKHFSAERLHAMASRVLQALQKEIACSTSAT